MMSNDFRLQIDFLNHKSLLISINLFPFQNKITMTTMKTTTT